MRLLTGLCLFLVSLLATDARATPSLNNSEGYYFDDFGDGTGVPSPFIVNAFREGLGTAMTIDGAWLAPAASCLAPNACAANEDCAGASPPSCCSEPATR